MVRCELKNNINRHSDRQDRQDKIIKSFFPTSKFHGVVNSRFTVITVLLSKKLPLICSRENAVLAPCCSQKINLHRNGTSGGQVVCFCVFNVIQPLTKASPMVYRAVAFRSLFGRLYCSASGWSSSSLMTKLSTSS